MISAVSERSAAEFARPSLPSTNGSPITTRMWGMLRGRKKTPDPAFPRCRLVFGGFAAGDLVMFQQMGFGAGVAVLIDATIVRSILVPASMKLLGDWNWYLPRWLMWLPDVRVESDGRGSQPLAPAGSAVQPTI